MDALVPGIALIGLTGIVLKAHSLKPGDLLASFGALRTSKQPESETAQA